MRRKIIAVVLRTLLRTRNPQMTVNPQGVFREEEEYQVRSANLGAAVRPPMFAFPNKAVQDLFD